VVQEDTGTVLYALTNLRNEPFTADTLRLSATNGIVLVLDVPRVADPPRTFDQMRMTAKRLAITSGRAGRRQQARRSTTRRWRRFARTSRRPPKRCARPASSLEARARSRSSEPE
jgi:hypothetical protein